MIACTTSRDATLLRDHGADGIAHPGGTLPAHLRRVRERLAARGARPALRLAGLSHAFYGADGFPAALLPLDPARIDPRLPREVGIRASRAVHPFPPLAEQAGLVGPRGRAQR
ncbi:DUF6817 domain-containing protein [Streptomyces sp. SCSIO 30461]|uniref:DUF6817 domain-containing protein n=1 Tax=Streptomyces sp. SCSIO 30461 TaxID=3118085 RepID=UPI0030CFF3CA